MTKENYKGFRYGVRTVSCEKTTLLLEVVATELTANPTDRRRDPQDSQDYHDLNPLELMELGAVYVNDERCLNPSREVSPGDQVRIHTSPRRFPLPLDLLSRIVAENEDSILIEKPAGLPTEATVDNVKENLLSYLEDLRGQSLLLAHRLAPESEGLLLIAKNSNAMKQILDAFKTGQIKRVYVAYVESAVSVGQYYLSSEVNSRPSEQYFKVLSCTELRAETNLLSENQTSWEIVGSPLSLCFRLEIEFIKARPKEIRAHLGLLGAPVLGDHLQGSRFELRDMRTRKAAIAFLAISLAIAE